MAIKRKIKELLKKREIVFKGGGDKAREKQVAMGKLLARDRIRVLMDEDSFNEYDLFVEHEARDFNMDKKTLHGDGVIIGTGTIFGAPICIYAQDFTVAGGSLGLMHSRKITKIMDHALKMRVPLIGINDSGGARIQEGVNSLAGYGEIFFRNTLSSGVIPQISVILGPCAGGAVYSPALTDFVFVVDKISKMFITGPEVIKTVLGEEISMEELGGGQKSMQKQLVMLISMPGVKLNASSKLKNSLHLFPGITHRRLKLLNPKSQNRNIKLTTLFLMIQPCLMMSGM